MQAIKEKALYMFGCGLPIYSTMFIKNHFFQNIQQAAFFMLVCCCDNLKSYILFID
jgi:hypothetical protein